MRFKAGQVTNAGIKERRSSLRLPVRQLVSAQLILLKILNVAVGVGGAGKVAVQGVSFYGTRQQADAGRT